jgi:hypothetical protein
MHRRPSPSWRRRMICTGSSPASEKSSSISCDLKGGVSLHLR